MELIQLENLLKEYDKKIEENVRLNRDVIKRLLTDKSEKRLNKEKIRALFYVLSPFILCIIILITDMQFYVSTHFYIGLGLFVPIYSLLYILDVKYYILLRKINLSAPVLSIRKRITALERSKLSMNRIRNVCMPVIVLAVLLMIIPNIVFTPQFVLMLILIAVIIAASMYYTRYSIQERYKALNKEIKELELLEK